MSRYRLSRSARKDLEEIWFAAATKESVDFATGVIDEISQRFPMLAGMRGAVVFVLKSTLTFAVFPSVTTSSTTGSRDAVRFRSRASFTESVIN